MNLLLLLSLPAAASDARLEALLADAGWDVAGQGSHELLGDVELALKQVTGTQCLRGRAQVSASPERMLEVVQDIEGALSWSKAGLVDTRVLARTGSGIDYLQVLDVPDWTAAADRYWVLRGQASNPGGAQVFSWDRFDWRSAFPDLASELATTRPKAVEPDPNFGAWAFRSTGSTSTITYYLCTESGSLPQWLQKAAATRTVPAAMADVVREAQRRAR